MEKNRSAIVDPILREIHRLKPTLKDEQIHILSPRFLAGDEETPFIYFPGNPQRVNTSASSPSTPSGMIPPRLKASAQTREANPPE